MIDADFRLVADCLEGRASSFEQLVRRHQARLYNGVYRLVGNPEDARDVVQETFLNAYRSLGRFKGVSRFFTWLYSIAMNAAVNLKRKNSARDREIPGLRLADDQGRRPSQPENALQAAEQQRHVQQALSRLSPGDRAVVVMRDMEDQRYSDIAQALQMPIGTVRSRLHRARRRLRKLLRRTLTDVTR